jgi:hypothetical protein
MLSTSSMKYVVEVHFYEHKYCTSRMGYRLYGLVVRVPGYGTEMYCAYCEVRIEFIYVM